MTKRAKTSSSSYGRRDREGLDDYGRVRRRKRERHEREAAGARRVIKDARRRRFDVVVCWRLDRLGRSLIDLLGTIQTLEACGVDLYLDQQSIDTTSPAGRLMFQITGAFAEFERSMIRQRVRAGLRRAVEAGKRLGRPKINPAIEKRIQSQLRAGKGILAVARECKVGTGTVHRIAKEIGRPFDAPSVVA